MHNINKDSQEPPLVTARYASVPPEPNITVQESDSIKRAPRTIQTMKASKIS